MGVFDDDDDEDLVADWDAFDAVVAQHQQKKQATQNQQQLQPHVSPHPPLSPGAAAAPAGVHAQSFARGQPHAGQPHALSGAAQAHQAQQQQQHQAAAPGQHHAPAVGTAASPRRQHTSRTPQGKRVRGLAMAPSPNRAHYTSGATGSFADPPVQHAMPPQQGHWAAQQHQQQQQPAHVQHMQQLPAQHHQLPVVHQQAHPALQHGGAAQPQGALGSRPPAHQMHGGAQLPQQLQQQAGSLDEVAQLRLQLQQAQERLVTEQGTNTVLRSRMERIQRQGANTAPGPLAAAAAVNAGGRPSGPLAALQAPDMQEELSAARTRLAFQEQEVAELKRRTQQQAARLKEAESAAEAARREASRAAEAKGQLEGELQAAQQQRGSGSGRSLAVAVVGRDVADASTSQLSPRVPSPQEGGARRSVAGQKRRLESGGSAADPSAPGRSNSSAMPIGGIPAPRAAVDGRQSGPGRGSGSSGRSSAAAAATAEPPADFGRSLLPPHALQHWAAAGTAPLPLQGGASVAVEPPKVSGTSSGTAPGQMLLLQQLWAAAPAAVATLLAASPVPAPNLDPWAPRDKRLPEVVAAQCSAIAAVQERLQRLGTAPGMLHGGALLLDALCALLAAMVPPPQQPQHRQPCVQPPQLDSEADLAAASLEAAAALLQHDSDAQAAALASCGAASASGAASTAGGGSNVQLRRSDGTAVQLPAPPWSGVSAKPPQLVVLHSVSAETSPDGARGLLAMLLRLVTAQRLPECAAAAAARALAALVAAAPADGGRAIMLPVFQSGALQRLAAGSVGERAAVPALLNGLLSDHTTATALQESLAVEEVASQTQTQADEGVAVAAAGGNADAAQSSWDLLRAWLGLMVLPAPALPPRTLAQAVQSMGLGPASVPPGQLAHAAAGAALGDGHPRDFWEADPCDGCAMARGAMAAVAGALARRQTWLLLSLLGDDGGIGTEGLAQQLVALLDAASRDPAGGILQGLQAAPCPGADHGMSLPPPDPSAGRISGSSGSAFADGDGDGSRPGAAGRAAWAQRLRVAQEALILLRSLLRDRDLGCAALDDLTASSQSARQALTVAHRLSAWRLPPSVAGDLDMQQALFIAPALPRWAAVAGASMGLSFRAPSVRGSSSRPALEDVRSMARHLQQRLAAHASLMSAPS